MHTVTKSSRVGVSAFPHVAVTGLRRVPMSKAVLFYDYSSRTRQSLLPPAYTTQRSFIPAAAFLALSPPDARIPRPPLPPRPPPRRSPRRPPRDQQCHRPRRHMEQQLGSLHGWCESLSSFVGIPNTVQDICVPAEMKFNYPNNSGISYSLYVLVLFPRSRLTHCSTNDGFFEEVQYQYNANASNPACIQAFIYWQHGTYTLNNNGSITLRPFASDGRIQVQDPCAATTNIITYYNNQVLFSDWGIVVDPSSGRYILNLNRYDGAKMARMFLTAKPPNMLPTQVLTGVNASGQTNTRRRRSFTSPLDFMKRSAAEPRWSALFQGYSAVMLGVGGLSVVSVLALV